MCRSRRELSNAYLLAKIGVDTAENEPCKVCPLSAHRSGSLSLLLQIPQVDALLANFTATKGEVLQNQPEDSLAYAKASAALTRVELEHKQIEDHILNLSASTENGEVSGRVRSCRGRNQRPHGKMGKSREGLRGKVQTRLRVRPLVERFDIEPSSACSAK